MKHWFKEPLLHFLIAGALLFAAHGWVNRGRDAPRDVRITGEEINWLKETWKRQWNRPPTEEELRGIVTEYLKEELLSREARALGLDDNDLVVRRRLAQKMKFLVEDAASLADPSEAELEAYYRDHKTEYLVPARISFSQVYFSREKNGERARENALLALNELLAAGSGAAAENLGDPQILSHEMAMADDAAVAGQFGRNFAAAVFNLEPGRWQGPVESEYGMHLVLVHTRQDARLKTFQEARTAVLNDWRRDQKMTIENEYFSKLFQKYDVRMDESVRALLGPVVLSGKNSQ